MRVHPFTTRPVSRDSGDPSSLGGKLLYQGENGWAMYEWESDNPAKTVLTGDESFLVHACTTSDHAVREVYIFPDTHIACWRCQVALPDGIKALWIMHNGRI